MSNRWQHVALAIVGAITIAARVSAQADSSRVAILGIPTGARPLGLGGAFVSGSGPEALFYNVAQVGSNRGSAVDAEQIGGATLGQFATTGSTGRFGFGLGVRFLSRGGNPVAGDSANLRGGALVAGVALATQVRGIWVGGAANFVSTDLAAGSRGASFDVGVAARRFGLLLGVSAQNLGRDIRTDAGIQQLPTRLSLGASLPATSISTYFDVAASAAISVERGGVVIPKGGLELIYEPLSGWTWTARAGVRRVVDRPGELRQSPVSLGASFGLNSLSLDYGFQPAVAGGQAVHSVGIRVQ